MNKMKVKIEIDSEAAETEVTIKCPEVTTEVVALQKLLAEYNTGDPRISFYKDEAEYFLSLSEILFFETGGGVIRAHTSADNFEAKYKLYELEEKLPSYFLRISKSTILNTRKVYSITKNLAGASKIEFQDTYKTVYCSRNYYKALKELMMPRGE